jgi:flavorubredoxin
MKAESYKISEGVYWVGSLDWDLRTYHGYTLDGTSYNCYLVFGEKTALIDNVYPGHSAQMWGRIADAFAKEGRKEQIDIIVQNHVEKDHSGALVEIHKKFPAAPIYCTEIAEKGLLRHFPALHGASFHHVKTGETLDLGGKTLAFVQAPAPLLCKAARYRHSRTRFDGCHAEVLREPDRAVDTALFEEG